MGMARAFSGFGGQSGEEHQFDFGGKGTVLMQSSEAVMETPAMVAEIEGQIAMLGVPGLQRVQQRVQQQLAAQQSQGSSGRHRRRALARRARRRCAVYRSFAQAVGMVR